ncbi:MAG: PGF-CTERM sorting domain-containing protein [Halobacteriota archaeon]|nr:PGF-CTERM sorting domain-containing protein [Halobacteriota archaeon]
MSRRVSMALTVAMILIVAMGFVGPVYAETLRDVHVSKGITLPESPDCKGCHANDVLQDGTTASVSKFHITHVETLSYSCTKCHMVDDPLPTLKALVPESVCYECHDSDGPGRVIYEGEAPPPITTTTPPTEPTTAPPTPTMGEEEETPGFEAVFAIAGLLAVAYLVQRRNR